MDGVQVTNMLCGMSKLRTLFVIRIAAVPNPSSDEFEECGGAYVNTWVDSSEEENAVAVATQSVIEYDWKIEEVESVRVVERDDYEEGDEGLRYFDEAIADGMSIVFHTWPNELQDDDLAN